jgi:hypothetical protein
MAEGKLAPPPIPRPLLTFSSDSGGKPATRGIFGIE